MRLLNKITNNNLKIAYKLLYDVLFICLIFFLGALVAEGIMPGIVTAHIGFSKLVAAIFILAFAIHIIANTLEIKPIPAKTNKKTAGLLLFTLALLVFNSLLKLNIFLNVFILLGILSVGYFIFRTIEEE